MSVKASLMSAITKGMIETGAIQEFKDKLVDMARVQADATKNKLDDKIVAILASTPADELVHEVCVLVIKAVYRMTRNAKNAMIDLAITMAAQFAGVTAEEYQA